MTTRAIGKYIDRVIIQNNPAEIMKWNEAVSTSQMFRYSILFRP